MKSIHENKGCILEKPKHKTWNLILWVLCKPSKHNFFEAKTVKPKIKTISLCVWTWATSKLNYSYTRSKLNKQANLHQSILLDLLLQVDSLQTWSIELDSISILSTRCDLDARALESTRVSFESHLPVHVKAKHQQWSWPISET